MLPQAILALPLHTENEQTRQLPRKFAHGAAVPQSQDRKVSTAPGLLSATQVQQDSDRLLMQHYKWQRQRQFTGGLPRIDLNQCSGLVDD